MYSFDDSEPLVRIKVVGVGGAGGNAINHMIERQLSGVSFIAANTDRQDLGTSRAETRLQLGPSITRGRGAGANPEKGKDAALESSDDIRQHLQNSDMVFITAGLGGGTGTGCAPVIAKISKELGALTVAVVTKPFQFEGASRMRKADQGWQELKKHVDTIITVSNNRLPSLDTGNTKLNELFLKVDDILYEAVRGITDLVNSPGMINLDFADLQAVMQEVGPAIMGAGVASGDNRAAEAAKAAIDNPLLEDAGIDGAKGVLINVCTAKDNVTMKEFADAAQIIQERADDDANICVGLLWDDELGDSMRVTVVATGINGQAVGGIVGPFGGGKRAPLSKPDFGMDKKPTILAPKPEPSDKRGPGPRQSDIMDLNQPAFFRKAAD